MQGLRLLRLLALVFALLSCLWSAPASATVDTVIKGVVRDELLSPLADAQIVLHDSLGRAVRKARTDREGNFVFTGIPFGEYSVEATFPGRTEAHRHVQATSSEIIDVELYCVASSEKAVIVEERELPSPSRAAGSLQTISREQLKAMPAGEDRPITEVVTTQPGFVQDAFGNVYARGNHANIQYQIDGIPIPDSVGNLFAQALPVRLIDSLEILSGGMPAEFGNRLAAVVNISTRRGSTTPEGMMQLRYGSFQTVEASGYYGRSVGPVSFFAGGSYMQSQRMLDTPAVTPILHDDGRNGRAFLRLDIAASARDRIEIFANYAHNFFQIPIDPTTVPLDPRRPDLVRPVDEFGNESPPYVPRDTDATETEHELFAALSWVHSFGDGRGQLQVAPYYKMSLGELASDPANALGALADPGTIVSDVRRRADHAGGILNYSLSRGNHVLKVGAQLNYLRGRTDFSQYFRDDSSDAGGIDASKSGGGTDHTGALLLGVYVQDRWDYGRFGLHAGVRWDWQHVSLSGNQSSDQLGLSPRLGLTFAFLKDLVAHSFFGVLFEPPAVLDIGNAARLLGVIPPTGVVPYDIQAETSVFGELGLSARIAKRLKLGATGWGRYAWNQLDNIAIGSTNLIANYNFERGRAVGVELTADFVFHDWLVAFANMSWLLAQGRGISSAKFLFSEEDLADTNWHTLDHAQSWTANVGLTLQYAGAVFTTLLNYGSGLRTGASNDQSVPQHVRVDASLQYSFDKLPLRPRIALDIVNLFDAHYAYRIANGFVGSSYAAPRSAFIRLMIPLTKGVAK